MNRAGQAATDQIEHYSSRARQPISQAHHRGRVAAVPRNAIAVAAVAVGVLGGLGLVTFHYAEGTSYLSADPAACVNCHIMRPQYDAWQKASHHAVATCVDCHDPDTMALRVTRPGFIQAIQALAAGDGDAPHLPSVERWRAGDRAAPYDPNAEASRTEMRSYVCGQCTNGSLHCVWYISLWS